MAPNSLISDRGRQLWLLKDTLVYAACTSHHNSDSVLLLSY